MFRFSVLCGLLIAFTFFVNAQNKHNNLFGIDNVKKGLSRDSLSKLKAILVVGPVEETTDSYIEDANEVAEYLKGLGVQVKTFYGDNALWDDIIKASKGAHIFYYSGHGTALGYNGATGGMCLANGSVSATEIETSLKLHKNALILFHCVCMGAGSSASDNEDIGVKVATQRVSDYSNIFIKNGAAGYYANNYGSGVISFVQDFFNRKPIKQVYTESAKSWCEIDVTVKYMYNPKYELSIASSNNSGGFATRTTYTNGVKTVEQIPTFKNYDIAYVGLPKFTIVDFFR